MFCRKCGKEIATGEKFCKHCGNAIIVSTEETKNGNAWFKKGNDLNERPHLSKVPEQDLRASSTMHTAKFYTPGDLENKKHSALPKVTPLKKPTKGTWIILGGVVSCVLVLVAVLAMLKLHTGPSKKEAQEQLNTMLESVYEGSSPDNFIIEALNGNVDVCVERIYPKNDNYIAECTVSAPDIATSISNYVNSLPANEDALYADVIKALKNELQTAPIITKSFDVRFVNFQGNWSPVVPEEMVIFCCGNIHELLPLIYGILGGSEK